MSSSSAAQAPWYSPAFLLLCLLTIGSVYGDIGTSSLYAIREILAHDPTLATTPSAVLAILSMVTWSLLLVVTIKYALLITRADNHGEGGILALLALVTSHPWSPRQLRWLTLAALLGTALLFGDGVITPAISVLSAVEGLQLLNPRLGRAVVPIAIALLVGLFALQAQGTRRIGALFGPIVLTWFLAQALLGAWAIRQAPEVLAALHPIHAWRFALLHPSLAFGMLGSVFLCVTGGEALYADLGHFGRRPIVLAWLWVVLPAMLLNYFGQGAYLLRHPTETENPFFALAPSWALVPLVVLAAAATLIASQALITALFSVVSQATAMGYLPRLRMVHTSASTQGQVYLPLVNWALLTSVTLVVVLFRSSGALAAAYGIAVTGTMIITTVLWAAVARYVWRWPLALVAPIGMALGTIDLLFLAANLLKVLDGGWLPLLIAVAALTVMTSWYVGRHLVQEALLRTRQPLADYLTHITQLDSHIARPLGTAVFLHGHDDEGVPRTLLQYVTFTGALPRTSIVLTVVTDPTPYVPNYQRCSVEPLGHGVTRVRVHRGFMQPARVPHMLALACGQGLRLDLDRVMYVLGRETVHPSPKAGMAVWREHLFAWLTRNAGSAATYFGLPPQQVFELGVHVDI